MVTLLKRYYSDSHTLRRHFLQISCNITLIDLPTVHLQIGSSLLLDATGAEQACASSIFSVAVNNAGACCGFNTSLGGLFEDIDVATALLVRHFVILTLHYCHILRNNCCDAVFYTVLCRLIDMFSLIFHRMRVHHQVLHSHGWKNASLLLVPQISTIVSILMCPLSGPVCWRKINR